MENTKTLEKTTLSISSKVYREAKQATIRDIKQILIYNKSVKSATLINILSTNVNFFTKLYSKT